MFLTGSFWPLLVRPAGILALLTIINPASAQLTINGYNGLTASISSNTYSLSIPHAGWLLAGTLGSLALNSRIGSGSDNLGSYQELAFNYAVVRHRFGPTQRGRWLCLP
jgi:hypothetical protein